MATASTRSHALQTQATVSPARRAGMEPSAASPAHLALLARAVDSCAPTAGLGRLVSQTLGTVSTVTLGGWGPGEGAGLCWVGCTFLQDPGSCYSLGGVAGPSPSTLIHTALGACLLGKCEGREMGAVEALGRVLFRLLCHSGILSSLLPL